MELRADSAGDPVCASAVLHTTGCAGQAVYSYPAFGEHRLKVIIQSVCCMCFLFCCRVILWRATLTCLPRAAHAHCTCDTSAFAQLAVKLTMSSAFVGAVLKSCSKQLFRGRCHHGHLGHSGTRNTGTKGRTQIRLAWVTIVNRPTTVTLNHLDSVLRAIAAQKCVRVVCLPRWDACARALQHAATRGFSFSSALSAAQRLCTSDCRPVSGSSVGPCQAEASSQPRRAAPERGPSWRIATSGIRLRCRWKWTRRMRS